MLIPSMWTGKFNNVMSILVKFTYKFNSHKNLSFPGRNWQVDLKNGKCKILGSQDNFKQRKSITKYYLTSKTYSWERKTNFRLTMYCLYEVWTYWTTWFRFSVLFVFTILIWAWPESEALCSLFFSWRNGHRWQYLTNPKPCH